MPHLLESATLMASDRPYEVVAQFWHPNDAAAYLSALASEDIRADLIDDNFSMLRTGLEFMSGGTKVIVPREDAARAREILGAAEASHAVPAASAEFSNADLARARIGRECPACGSTILTSPQRPALAGAVVLSVMTAAFASGLPFPVWATAVVSAALIPVYYRILFRLMPTWQCKVCEARWEMPRG